MIYKEERKNRLFQYGNALTDEQASAVAGKAVTRLQPQPLPYNWNRSSPARLAMRTGDAVETNYVSSCGLNIARSSGLSASVKPVFTPVPEGIALNYEVEMKIPSSKASIFREMIPLKRKSLLNLA